MKITERNGRRERRQPTNLLSGHLLGVDVIADAAAGLQGLDDVLVLPADLVSQPAQLTVLGSQRHGQYRTDATHGQFGYSQTQFSVPN